MSKSKELNTLRLLDVLKKGKLPAKFHLFGLGEAYTTANTSKNRHVVNVNVNPEAVQKSFESFEKSFRSKLSVSINRFYAIDPNKWDKSSGPRQLDFKIKVSPSRLNKTSFTYIYQFELSFKDRDIHVNIVDNLQNLPELIKRFRKDFVICYNQPIPPAPYGKKRDENELDISQVLNLCGEYRISKIQENAPVISASTGKFNLTQIDLSELVKNVLYKRARKLDTDESDRAYNETIFKAYCIGKSDAQIALQYKRFGWFGSTLLGIATGMLYGFTPYGLSQIHDAYTIWVEDDILSEIGEDKLAILQTLPINKKSKWERRLSNYIIPTIDIAGFALGTIPGVTTGAIGAVWQGIHYIRSSKTIKEENAEVLKNINDDSSVLTNILKCLFSRKKSKLVNDKGEKTGDIVFSGVMESQYTMGPNDDIDHEYRSWNGLKPQKGEMTQFQNRSHKHK